MTKHRTIASLVTAFLLAAVASAVILRSHATGTFNAAQAGFRGAMPGTEIIIKKPVRYEVIIDNWKRYRSTKPNE
jgi:hypothetical protein